MDLFQSILANIKKKLDSEAGRTETIARVISENLGVTVSPGMVIQKGTHITLKIPSTARMALTMKRQAILLALQKEGVTILSIN